MIYRTKSTIKRILKKVLPAPVIDALRQKTSPIPLYKPQVNFDVDKIEKDIEQLKQKPLISVVMPVYNVDPNWLDLAIKSVQNQFYKKWELCIADDCSTNIKTKKYLENIKDEKIKVKFLENNVNISRATNEAVSLAKGEYIALLDNDDELTPDALFEVVKVINETGADFIYSDEDKIDKEGFRSLPFYKPDWSPDLLRSQMYICHLSVTRKKLFDSIGGFRVGYEGSQDYDLVLRMTEKTNKISHIPKVLYSWRQLETSTSTNPYSKTYAQDAGYKALSDHLIRVFGEGNAWAVEDKNLFVYDTRYKLPTPKPMVSIIIPTKDKIDLLAPCIESIISKTTYTNYEVLILDNNSEEKQTKEWFKEQELKYKNIRVINAHYDFNWSKLNNHGMREAQGDIFVFLNNDTLVISEDWLERLAEKALRKDVGTVGALLLFEDGTIQHAGVVVGLGGWADHIYRGMLPQHMVSPYVSPMVTRNVTSSTGACLAISKNTIENIGLFDENFMICGSDVEISLRALKKGYLNIYDPHVRLYHLESKTRNSFVPECDFQLSAIHYSPYREIGDPYYNKNLSLENNILTLRCD